MNKSALLVASFSLLGNLGCASLLFREGYKPEKPSTSSCASGGQVEGVKLGTSSRFVEIVSGSRPRVSFHGAFLLPLIPTEFGGDDPITIEIWPRLYSPVSTDLSQWSIVTEDGKSLPVHALNDKPPPNGSENLGMLSAGWSRYARLQFAASIRSVKSFVLHTGEMKTDEITLPPTEIAWVREKYKVYTPIWGVPDVFGPHTQMPCR